MLAASDPDPDPLSESFPPEGGTELSGTLEGEEVSGALEGGLELSGSLEVFSEGSELSGAEETDAAFTVTSKVAVLPS